MIDTKASDFCDFYQMSSYPKTNSWNKAVDCCSWDGVTCANVTGNVINLNLSCSWLRGTLRSNISLILPKLEVLQLFGNNFQGPLPIPPPSPSYFNASSNGFTGEIPLSICQLKSLRYLDLSANNLSGNIPPCLGSMTNLSYLILSRNNFQGPFPIPPPSTSYFSASSNGFTGEIPLSICQLKSLHHLDLSANNLSGNIPLCLGSMTNLSYLILSRNNFQGPLISLICLPIISLAIQWFHRNMTNLLVLNLSSNYFTGQLPTKVFLNNSLDVIDLSNNMIRGPIPLPSPITFYYDIARNDITGKITPLICNATKLEVIDLSNNSLTSRLPRCLTNFSTKLLVLNLRKNHLEGTIPQSFSSRSNLATLNLSRNWFEGTLPRSLVECKHLEVPDLSNNQIEDTFPSWLGKLPELKVLNLRSNNFKDLLNIPRGAHLFSNLHILDLSNNNFRGPLPTNLLMNLKAMTDGKTGQEKLLYMTRQSYENSMTLTMKGLEIELVKILTILTTVDLSHNSFQGDIPEVFGHLHSLIGLNLSHNYLTGSIPLTLGNLTNLEWLDLSSNKLSGGIPRKLGDLSFLGSLNLSKNQLTGHIPQDKQLSTFSSDSFSGNPGLCGTPLPKACPSNAQPPQPSPSSTFDCEGHESWFKQKKVWIGYASRIVIGISIAYIAFEIGRPKWLAR
ncbi:hypothetical protein EUGRSUZ_I01762, partial [Eucalyptus grandis]